jgi:hypothetical protein
VFMPSKDFCVDPTTMDVSSRLDNKEPDCITSDNTNDATITFAMEKLTNHNTNIGDEEIARRLQSFTAKYEELLESLDQSSMVIQNSSQYAEAQLRAGIYGEYRKKLVEVRQAMTKIDVKLFAIQQHLNDVRKKLPSRKSSLVEPGPFFYKCIYPGGVRFRDFPSANAKVVRDDLLVAHNEIVEVAERVFVSAEHSVYLHKKGVGWLFENKKEIICFERVADPSER